MVTVKLNLPRGELGSDTDSNNTGMGDCLGIYWMNPEFEEDMEPVLVQDERLFQVANRLRLIGDQLDQEIFLSRHMPYHILNELMDGYRSSRYFSDSFSMFFHVLAMLYVSRQQHRNCPSWPGPRQQQQRRRDSC